MGSAGQAQGELTVPCIFQVGASQEPGDKADSHGDKGFTCGFRGLGPSCLAPFIRQAGGGRSRCGVVGGPSKLQQSRELHISLGSQETRGTTAPPFTARPRPSTQDHGASGERE